MGGFEHHHYVEWPLPQQSSFPCRAPADHGPCACLGSSCEYWDTGEDPAYWGQGMFEWEQQFGRWQHVIKHAIGYDRTSIILGVYRNSYSAYAPPHESTYWNDIQDMCELGLMEYVNSLPSGLAYFKATPEGIAWATADMHTPDTWWEER